MPIAGLADHFISIDATLEAIRTDLSSSVSLNNPSQRSRLVDLFCSVSYSQEGHIRGASQAGYCSRATLTRVVCLGLMTTFFCLDSFLAKLAKVTW